MATTNDLSIHSPPSELIPKGIKTHPKAKKCHVSHALRDRAILKSPVIVENITKLLFVSISMLGKVFRRGVPCVRSIVDDRSKDHDLPRNMFLAAHSIGDNHSRDREDLDASEAVPNDDDRFPRPMSSTSAHIDPSQISYSPFFHQ